MFERRAWGLFLAFLFKMKPLTLMLAVSVGSDRIGSAQLTQNLGAAKSEDSGIAQYLKRNSSQNRIESCLFRVISLTMLPEATKITTNTQTHERPMTFHRDLGDSDSNPASSLLR